MKSYEPIRGNPHRKTLAERRAKKQASKGRKRRVNVTPNDWDQLEAMAEKLGLPYSKIYNMAFSLLLAQHEEP